MGLDYISVLAKRMYRFSIARFCLTFNILLVFAIIPYLEDLD